MSHKSTKIIQAASIGTALIALVALGLSVALFLSRTSQIQTSRADSATDTCFLFRKIVLAASAEKGQLLQGEVFLRQNGLVDCDTYGKNVTKLK